VVSQKSIERKQKKIDELSEIFKNNGVYLFDYRGLAVKEMEDLRNKIKTLNAHLKVIKNRMAIKYFENEEQKYGRDVFRGPIAIAYSDEKFVEVAKVIVDFEKDNKKIKIKSGFIEKQFVDGQQIKNLAKLPGRTQLISQLAFSMSMPVRKLGQTLTAPIMNMLILLNNIKDKKAKED